jgi:8-oxo-dGTP diphosphatase
MDEQNIDRARYKVIPRTLIFIFYGDEILLINKVGSNIWDGKSNVLGGHIENGEDIVSSAQRELLEEAGLSAVELHYCGNIMISAEKDLGIALHLFKGEAKTKAITASNEGSLAWVKVDDIKLYPVKKDLYELLPLVKEWTTGDSLIIGKYKKSGDKDLQRYKTE